MLLSAGVRLPDTIFVHEYLTAGGQKFSKSAGNAEDPTDIAAAHGTDAVRWWMVRDVARAGDTDYTVERLVARVNEDLANNVGNLVNRTVSMVQRYRHGVIPGLAADHPAADDLRAARFDAAPAIDWALAEFGFRRAAEAVLRIGHEGNRFIEAVHPWYWPRPNATTMLAAVLLTRCSPSWSPPAATLPSISSRFCSPSPAASPSNAAMTARQ